MGNSKYAGCCSHCGARCFTEHTVLKQYKSVAFKMVPDAQAMFILCKECLKAELDFAKMEQFMRDGWEEELGVMSKTAEEKQHYRDVFFGLKIKERV